MTYIGQQPSTTFDSGIQDRFTGLTTNTVTLTHDISAETDILVVWNNIVQDSGTYSVGGTGNKTLTLGGTLVSADIVTVYYTNKVMQSVNPTAGSVTTTTINDSAVTNDKLAGSIANSKLSNSSITLNGSAVSLGGSATVGGDNTPSFSAYASAAQAVSTDTHTKINFDSEYWDTDSAYDTTNKRFVIPSGESGKYAIAASIGWLQWSNTSGSLLQDKRIQIQIRINGSGVNIRGLLQTNNSSTQSGQNNLSVSTAGTIELSAGDYIEVFGTHNSGHNVDTYQQYSWFTGHKLIGV